MSLCVVWVGYFAVFKGLLSTTKNNIVWRVLFYLIAIFNLILGFNFAASIIANLPYYNDIIKFIKRVEKSKGINEVIKK